MTTTEATDFDIARLRARRTNKWHKFPPDVLPAWVADMDRDKVAFSSGCKAHPATAPAGSNRGRHGGDEMSEAPG